MAMWDLYVDEERVSLSNYPSLCLYINSVWHCSQLWKYILPISLQCAPSFPLVNLFVDRYHFQDILVFQTCAASHYKNVPHGFPYFLPSNNVNILIFSLMPL